MANPTVFILVVIGILPKCMFYLLISGRQHQVIIPIPQAQYLYYSWDWNLAKMHVSFYIDIWKTGSRFYLLIYRAGDQIIIPIAQYLY